MVNVNMLLEYFPIKFLIGSGILFIALTRSLFEVLTGLGLSSNASRD